MLVEADGVAPTVTTYVCIFRTHVWDDHVAKVAKAARASCASGTFIVAVDETNGPVAVGDFLKLPHTNDFSALRLPNLPAGKVLWWNGDYPLYLAAEKWPGFDYYIVVEYDALMHCDADKMIARCAAEGVDLVVHDLQRITADNHWCYDSVSEMNVETWQALIPVLIVSARAAAILLRTRQAMAAELRGEGADKWPYCEAFIPTVALRHGLKVARLENFVDARLCRFRPFISLRDQRLQAAEMIAHPVLGGRRFVKAFSDWEPPGAHIMTDGYLREELENEDPEDIQAVFGKAYLPYDAAKAAAERPHLIDVASGKPATQSSHSKWSRAPTAEEDASQANGKTMPHDYAFHTALEKNPWWAVDFLEECVIEHVEIINRTVVEMRFYRFEIEISLSGDEWVGVFKKTDGAMISGNPARPAVFWLNHPVRARYLRIVLLDENFLHLRRVRVMGLPVRRLVAPEPDAGAFMTPPAAAETLSDRMAL